MPHHEESSEHFFTAFTDLLVGVIFLFMLLLMVFGLNLKQDEVVEEPTFTSDEIRAHVLTEIGKRMAEGGTALKLDPANGIVRLPEEQLFESGQWKLSEQGTQMVVTLAKVLAELLPCAATSTAPCDWYTQPITLDSVLIEGHTDKRPFSSPQGYGNWELSAFRAISVYETMVAAQPQLEQGITNLGREPLLGVSAYADRRPVDRVNLDPNRRIDIRFNMHATDYQPRLTKKAAPKPTPMPIPAP